MGQRANLVLVDGTGYHLYYCHWCANTIPKDVFWGPQFTIPFILQQRLVSKDDGWLDDVWSEGGVVVDTVKNVVLLYGGEDIQYDPRLRRVYLELMQETWAGWEIRWAHEGIFDMADYVGVPRRVVTSKPMEPDDRVTSLDVPEKPDRTDTVGTVILEDGKLRLYPLDGDPEWYLNRGEALVEMARQNPGVDKVPLHEWLKEFLYGGFHIDVTKKQIAIWTAHDQNLLELIRPIWTGWDILWLKDDYEYQARLAEGRLIFPTMPIEKVLAHLESILMAGGSSGLVSLLEMIREKEDAGHDVQVNTFALRDDPQNVPVTDKKVILDRVIANWKQKRLLN